MRTRTLQSLHNRFSRGEITKSEIERQYFDRHGDHGKYITRLWFDRLGLDTRRNPKVPVSVGIK